MGEDVIFWSFPKNSCCQGRRKRSLLEQRQSKGATGHGRREYCSIVLMLLKKTAALNGCFIVPENFVHRKMTKYDGFRKGNAI
ncbi:hypothetical protein BSBH6_00017 [Bacillus subtilis]|nr:hypothetical protein BSBH6_00017 [Bacillus subtilis]RPK26382.1 hypothetical protein BH5_00017 [Bacillus subtilis]